MPLALLILAVSAFAIGTTEFVIMGLLPEVAQSLAVDIPTAGWLVTGYALAVAFGAPIMAAATARLPHRTALITLMGFFIAGNVLCALATGYGLLMFARVVTALCHGAFFGIGAVTAAALVAPHKRAQAVALMFTGLTLANVLGVPLGTAFGQVFGWRATFWGVSAIGIVAILGLIAILPRDEPRRENTMWQEFAALKGAGLWLSLATTALFAASMFALFTYIAPLLRDVTGLSPQGVTWSLFVIGIGLTLGNLGGGKLADWNLGMALALVFVAIALTSLAFSFTSGFLIPAEINLFLWAAATFAAVPALQVNVVRFGSAAPNLVSTMNIGAFNLGNALGAWVGGMVIDLGFHLTLVPVSAALLAIAGLALATATTRKATRLANATS